MLHRQTSAQPLIPGGQGGGAPPVNPSPAQANVPVSQPQPGVSKTEVKLLQNMVTLYLLSLKKCPSSSWKWM